MLRSALAAGLVALSTAALAQSAAPQFHGVTLKDAATVSSELVRIGDLVENAGPLASTAIFRAPNFGETGTVSAQQIAEAIRPHGLRVELGGALSVAVTRAGRAVTPADIEARIARALAEHAGLRDASSLAISFDQPPRTLHLEPSNGDLQVVRISYAPRANRFDVTFELPAADSSRRALYRYAGSVTDTIEVVLVKRAVARDEVVGPEDLILERRPRSSVSGEPIRRLEDAIGLAARRPLRPGTALQSGDLAKANLIQRNEAVLLVYEAPGIVVTLRGKALESGAEGEVVSVMNLQSKRTLQAVVIGPGQVGISAPQIPARLVSETGAATRRRTE